MISINKYPKSIKKAIRYIKQDASKEQLEEIKKLLEQAIQSRNMKINEKGEGNDVSTEDIAIYCS